MVVMMVMIISPISWHDDHLAAISIRRIAVTWIEGVVVVVVVMMMVVMVVVLSQLDVAFC